MTRTLWKSLLVASMLVVIWTTASEACWRRHRGYAATTYGSNGYSSAAPQGYYGGGGGYGTAGAGYYSGGYPGGTAGGYDFGRPGYNPGGLGGPRSGIGVRPGMGAGGLGLGR
jgi:hypothetical protein